MSPCDDTVVYESLYAPGIGLIKTQQSLYSYVMIECRYHERRLVNYFIADQSKQSKNTSRARK